MCSLFNKRKELRGLGVWVKEKVRKGTLFLTFVPFCLQGIKIILPYAHGWEFQLRELYILHCTKTLMCSQQFKTSIVGPLSMQGIKILAAVLLHAE